MAAPAAIPPTMRAVRYTAFGGPLETVTLPTPTPAKGEVLVKVAAAALISNALSADAAAAEKAALVCSCVSRRMTAAMTISSMPASRNTS